MSTASMTDSAAPAEPEAKGSLGVVPALLVWLPMAAVGAGAVGMWHFVSFAFVSNPVLNGLILGVALWGGATMVGHVRRAYREDRTFVMGIDWLRRGVWSDSPNPKLGPDAFVVGLLGRLEKLGLGHQISMQSAVTEPEIEALADYFERKQELSQFIVGLMVGLGLLGTFIGLLETLVATSGLISTIANSVGGSGGGMESEFARIVGGLQKPLAAMGTAFSASMFGLIGSIMLGFQMILVRRTCAAVVDHVRENVLSLAEKSSVNATAEISERFLATLLADMLEQGRRSEEGLRGVVDRLAEFTPRFEQAARSNERLAQEVGLHGEVLGRTAAAMAQVRDLVPAIGELATQTSQVMEECSQTRLDLRDVLRQLPDLQIMRGEMTVTLAAIDDLARGVAETREMTAALAAELRHQGSVTQRLELALVTAERERLHAVLKPTLMASVRSRVRRMIDDDDQRNAS
ncbi:MAG: hypothetical protein ABW278_16625 [Steroidobacteraceae bacterium]